MSRREKKKNSNKSKVIIVLFIIIAIIISIVIYNLTKKEDKEIEVAKTPVDETPVSEEPVEEEEYYDESIQYENEYEEAVLKRTNKNNDYKIIEINGSKYHGYLTVIYEPSRLGVVATSQIGKAGEFLVDISKANNAVFGVNGGGFADANFNGDGSTPLGITISNGKYLTQSSYGGSYGIIGLDKDNKLILGKYSVEQTKSLGIRDAVTFGPFLIQDGKPVKDTGTAAVGRASRTAIAQRADGLIMFLVLDGDRTKGQGALYKEEIEILQKYGAVNAANLDGGTSSCMTIHSNLVNDPTSMNGEHRTREISTAFILKPDEKDNGDYSVVADKVK